MTSAGREGGVGRDSGAGGPPGIAELMHGLDGGGHR